MVFMRIERQIRANQVKWVLWLLEQVVWQNIPGRGKSMCEDLVVGKTLVYLKIRMRTTLANA